MALTSASAAARSAIAWSSVDWAMLLAATRLRWRSILACFNTSWAFFDTSCAWRLASSAWSISIRFSMVAGSISATSWFCSTLSPISKCRAFNWPETWAPASTDLTASSVPTAVTLFSMSPRITAWVTMAAPVGLVA
ncbi:hypothetical protein BKP54_24590 [Ensifer sp. 1H6]|nr:hypothetical protein BKP54_24590 [Ensifer sp. 1H6]